MLVFIVCAAALLVFGGGMALLGRFQRRYMEPAFMILGLVGILMLCQPLVFTLYRYGFAVLLTAFVGYNVASRIR